MSFLGFALFDGQPESDVAFAFGLSFLIASITAGVMGRLVRITLKAIYGAQEDASRHISRSVTVTRLVTFLLILPVTALPMLDAVGQQYDLGLDQRSAVRWLLASGIRIAVIVTLAWLVVRIVVNATARLEKELARGTLPGSPDGLKRAQTLGALLKNVAVTFIVIVALLMVLRELQVDIMPMLTGAGIAGVALGFGAQWLVRDLIAGIFLILEDQVRVGDSVVINGQGGGVEAINLRTIVLRDGEGAVHIFPNGAITTLANKTRDYAYYMIDVNVDFREDTDRVTEILRETAATLHDDPQFGPSILEPLEVLGVEGFKDGQVTLRSRIKTLPQKQWEVGRELRRRLRYALHRAGIQVPAAALHTVIARRETP